MAVTMTPVETECSGRHIVDLPHVEQCYTWDCGLACLSMVLRYFDIPSQEVYTKDLDAQQCGESVWTIDLAYIIARYTIPHRLCTVTLGANVDHASKSFYTGFSKDEQRVNKLFQDAASHGVVVEKRSVAMEEVISHVSDGGLAIVLSDWRYLECIWCPPEIRKCSLCCMIGSSGYQGHFIVVCGFDKRKRYIFYKNPNTDENLCCCRYESFDKARKSDGTDEDILFIFKAQRSSGLS